MIEDRFLFVSDYILADLRHLFEPAQDVYFKWKLLNASNGAAITTAAGSIECYFFQPERIPTSLQESAEPLMTRRFDLAEMVVFMSAHQIALDDHIRARVEQAYANAITLAESNPEELNRIRSIVMACMVSTPPSNQFDISEQLFEPFTRILNVVPRIMPAPSLTQTSDYYYDLEYRLESPIMHRQCIEILGSFFPGIQRSLFGYGQIIVNHDGGSAWDQRLKWAHIVCRHF